MNKPLTKKKSRSKTGKPTTLEEALEVLAIYNQKFDELDSFVDFVRDQREELTAKRAEYAEAKATADALKAEVNALQDCVSGAKDALFRLIEPGMDKFMPLFDRMEPADAKKHGEHAKMWRKDPISALRLSAAAATLLVEAEIIAVGQLQDRVLADAESWWEKITGLTAPMAAAIVDRLNDFIMKDGGRN